MFFFFFFNDTATTEIYTLSLHDALPICSVLIYEGHDVPKTKLTPRPKKVDQPIDAPNGAATRSEEHTSELQSRLHLVCRLLLEKKKKKKNHTNKMTTYRERPQLQPHSPN